ncbi:hypothetical protein RQP46_010162 [Phenoliferia psychrophenolica]
MSEDDELILTDGTFGGADSDSMIQDLNNDDDDSLSDSGFSSDSDFGPSIVVHNDSKGKGRLEGAGGVDFSVLSLDDIHEQQRSAIEAVQEMLGLKESETAVLLRFFAWKKEKLIEKYMEDPEKTLSSAGIHEGGSQPRLKRVRGFVCDVCYESDDGETLALSCNMRFCKDCYARYVESKIMDDSESRRIQCMDSNCNVVIDEKTIELLVSPSVLVRYKSLLDRTYVDDTPSLTWCPFPNCIYAISCAVPSRSLDTIIPTVVCRCKTQFCFGCGEGDHRPCPCAITRRWRKKCEDDSETTNWLNANTKDCPKCQQTIEKNGGCQHMTCRKCRWEFCWVCKANWTDHNSVPHSCARYEGKDDPEVTQSASRASLERYLHYYTRFANHEQATKLEQDLYERTEKKIGEMQQASELSWIECQFLSTAVETLGRCRLFLKWTYAMTFYLVKNNHTHMLEDNQNDLEQAVESLAALLERPVIEGKIPELRQLMTDKAAYVARRCQIMLEDTLRGYDEERWVWTQPILL